MFSYDGSVSWGINGDFEVMPDLQVFGDTVLEEFNELLNAAKAAPDPDKGAPRASGPRKRPPLGGAAPAA